MNRARVTFSKGKAKDVKYTLKRLGTYLYKYRILLITAFILNVVASILGLLGPLYLGKALGLIEQGMKMSVDFDLLKDYVIILLVIYISSSLLQMLLSIVMIKSSKKIVYQMRHDAFNKIIILPVSFFDNNMSGDIISRMNYDIDTVNTSLSTDLIQILTSIITIVGSFIMMIIISPILVLVFFVTIPVTILFTRLMIKKTSKYFKLRSKNLGLLSANIEEMITGSTTIKVYGKEQEIIDNFTEYNIKSADASYMAEYYSAYTGPGVNFVNNLSLSLICLLGAICMKLNLLLFENVSQFVFYSRKFSGPVNEIANIITDLQSALAAGERVFELIDGEPESSDIEGAKALDKAEGNTKFCHITFGYNPNIPIIKDVSFKVNAGEVCAIVGPTGAGKTTIVNLLMRFYDINSGNIYLDDTSLYNLKRKSLRKNFAMVLQDTWLFEGTVFENLTYGAKNKTLDDCIKACKSAQIDSFINHLPNGYDTILKDNGTMISKGQKQLLTIARAMLLDAQLLILDEATSNVDTRTEIKIQKAMKELMKNKTCFIIAHRLSTIKNADVILVVKDGNIIEQGTHSSLLNDKGFYYELFNSQYH